MKRLKCDFCLTFSLMKYLSKLYKLKTSQLRFVGGRSLRGKLLVRQFGVKSNNKINIKLNDLRSKL